MGKFIEGATSLDFTGLFCNEDFHVWVDGKTTCLCGKKKKEKETEDHPMQYGWICPRCGAANAPFSSRCACVPYPVPIVTCGEGGTGAPTYPNPNVWFTTSGEARTTPLQ